MAFLEQLAYGGPKTWRDHCEPAEPQLAGDGCLAPPWGDAIKAAKQFEQQNPNWQQMPGFEDGPCGQVIGFLQSLGHEPFVEAANMTEQAAENAPQVIGMQAPGQEQMGGNSPPHMQLLSSLSKIEIRENASLIEAITAALGQEIEMANKYRIYNDGGQEELFFAVEETDCCTRQMKQCAPDCAPWNLSVLYTQNGNSAQVYKLTRPCTCTFLCCNRPKVDLIDTMTGQKLGSMVDPFACCDLTFTINDENDSPVLKASGGCCQPGLCCPLPCGPCAEVNFPVSDAASGSEVGHIQKKVPGCCKFLFASDVDNYKVDFGGVTNPNYKMLLIALAIFMDFRYFNDNRNDDQGGIMGNENAF